MADAGVRTEDGTEEEKENRVPSGLESGGEGEGEGEGGGEGGTLLDDERQVTSPLAVWVQKHLYRSRSDPSWALLSSAAGISGEATWGAIRSLLSVASDYEEFRGESAPQVRAVDIGCGRGNVVCAWIACLAEQKDVRAHVWGLDADSTSLSFARRWDEKLTSQMVEYGLHDRLWSEIDEEPCCVDETSTPPEVWERLRAQTHLYIFNKGMPPTVLRALARHVFMHPESVWHRLYLWHGAGVQRQLEDPDDASIAEFWSTRVVLDRVQRANLRGSGEGYSMRVWKRRCERDE